MTLVAGIIAGLMLPGAWVRAAETQVTQSEAQIRAGDSLVDALATYRTLGINVVSSSTTLPVRLTVAEVPDPALAPLDQIRALLAPHGLTIAAYGNQAWVVVKPPGVAPIAPDGARAPRAASGVTPPMEEMDVSASRSRIA
jgi:hypothetical protein